MRIRYTKHAKKKFSDLRIFGVVVTKSNVSDTINKPRYHSKDNGNSIAAVSFDKKHNLRVVYRKQKSDRIVGMAKIKYRYDKDDDVLMVFLGKGQIDDAQQSGNIISHFSAKGDLLLLEILDASKFLKETSQVFPLDIREQALSV